MFILFAKVSAVVSSRFDFDEMTLRCCAVPIATNVFWALVIRTHGHLRAEWETVASVKKDVADASASKNAIYASTKTFMQLRSMNESNNQTVPAMWTNQTNFSETHSRNFTDSLNADNNPTLNFTDSLNTEDTIVGPWIAPRSWSKRLKPANKTILPDLHAIEALVNQYVAEHAVGVPSSNSHGLNFYHSSIWMPTPVG